MGALFCLQAFIIVRERLEEATMVQLAPLMALAEGSIIAFACWRDCRHHQEIA
jgi:hypothetical protein